MRKPLICRLANGMKIRAYPRCVESSAAMYVRWPDRPEVEWLRGNLHHGEMVLDIGANIGLWSLLLADVVGPENVIAFEPGRVAYLRLKENFQLNGISERQAMNVALGKVRGNIEFPDPDVPDTSISLLGINQKQRSIQVPQIPLDSLAPSFRGKKIGLIKIDVEGVEAEVLEGASEILRKIRTRIILFESFTPDHFQRCEEVLKRSGYALMGNQRGMKPPSSPQNHFAIPEPLQNN